MKFALFFSFRLFSVSLKLITSRCGILLHPLLHFGKLGEKRPRKLHRILSLVSAKLIKALFLLLKCSFDYSNKFVLVSAFFKIWYELIKYNLRSITQFCVITFTALSVSSCSSQVMVSIAEFLIGHGSHGTVLLRYLRDLTMCKIEFLRKHQVGWALIIIHHVVI